jgi:hypothetical protein
MYCSIRERFLQVHSVTDDAVLLLGRSV